VTKFRLAGVAPPYELGRRPAEENGREPVEYRVIRLPKFIFAGPV
jgi:hypothetical protein